MVFYNFRKQKWRNIDLILWLAIRKLPANYVAAQWSISRIDFGAMLFTAKENIKKTDSLES